jgi:hypothetical protein
VVAPLASEIAAGDFPQLAVDKGKELVGRCGMLGRHSGLTLQFAGFSGGCRVNPQKTTVTDTPASGTCGEPARSTDMRKTLTAAFLAVGVIAATPAQSQTLYSCSEGSIQDVRSLTEVALARTAGTSRNSASLPSPERIFEDPGAGHLISVELHDRVYTGYFVSTPGRFDAARLTTNDDVTVCVNGGQIIVDRLDGTDYSGRIVRTERIRDVLTDEE